MNKKTYIALGVTLAVLGGGFFVYNRYFNKNRFVRMIVKAKPNLDAKDLKTYDLGYLRGRAFALKNGDATFDFKGKTYNTSDGKLTR